MIKIIDDFFSDPWTMRAMALESEKWERPEDVHYYTASLSQEEYFETSGIKKRIEDEVGCELVAHSAGFRLNTIHNTTWVHTDHPAADYSIIIYLNPNPPVDHGTTFLTHKEYGNMSGRVNIDVAGNTLMSKYITSDMSQWKVVDVIGNVFNRCVIMNSKYWHKPTYAGFGYDKHTGRLTFSAFLKIKNDTHNR